MKRYIIADKNCEPIVMRDSKREQYIIEECGYSSRTAASDVVEILRNHEVECKAILVEEI